MLNPSTADANVDDPTIRRCMRFAGQNGYGGVIVANLFAYRATDPKDLPKDQTAVGPENDTHLLDLIDKADEYHVVFAWGTKGSLLGRDKQVITMFPSAFCLQKTKDGHPKHPLYIPNSATLIPFENNKQ